MGAGIQVANIVATIMGVHVLVVGLALAVLSFRVGVAIVRWLRSTVA